MKEIVMKQIILISTVIVLLCTPVFGKENGDVKIELLRRIKIWHEVSGSHRMQNPQWAVRHDEFIEITTLGLRIIPFLFHEDVKNALGPIALNRLCCMLIGQRDEWIGQFNPTDIYASIEFYEKKYKEIEKLYEEIDDRNHIIKEYLQEIEDGKQVDNILVYQAVEESIRSSHAISDQLLKRIMYTQRYNKNNTSDNVENRLNWWQENSFKFQVVK